MTLQEVYKKMGDPIMEIFNTKWKGKTMPAVDSDEYHELIDDVQQAVLKAYRSIPPIYLDQYNIPTPLIECLDLNHGAIKVIWKTKTGAL